MIELYTDRTQLNKKSIDPIPSGIVNALKIRVTFDSSYNDLIKFVVFKCGETTLASMGDTLEYNIPWEILVKQNEGKEILVGVYGSNGTDVILTTNYVSIGKLIKGCDIEDTFSEPPSPSVVQFILDAANQAVNTANEALEVANDEQNIAKQWAGVAEENAQTATTKAEESQQSAAQSLSSAQTATVQANRASSEADRASNKAEEAKSHAEQTGEDRIATGEDRVATGADRSAVNTALLGFAETTLPDAIQAVEDKADTEIARVGQASDTQVQAVNAAGAEQIGLATAQADRAETAQGKAEEAREGAETAETNAGNSATAAAEHDILTQTGLTDEQKDIARQNINAAKMSGSYEFIETITLTEAVASIVRTQEPDGTPYSFERLKLMVHTTAATASSVLNVSAFCGETKIISLGMSGLLNTSDRYSMLEFYDDNNIWSGGATSAAGGLWANGWNVLPTFDPKLRQVYTEINKIQFEPSTASVLIPAGTVISIYGVRA